MTGRIKSRMHDIGRTHPLRVTDRIVLYTSRCQQRSKLIIVTSKLSTSIDLNAAISVRDLKLTFGGGGSRKQVLAGVDLDIPRGTFHMLLGANGCGKSTLLRVLAGLLQPSSGQFHIDLPCGVVFQNPDHQVVLPTVSADVAFGLGRYTQLSEHQVSALVLHALDRVGLAGYADRPTSSLSGGQKQRVAIAGALAENPRVLLLDELTTFLDGRDQNNVLACVRSVIDKSNSSNTNVNSDGVKNSSSVTALWVTHRLEEVEYADYVSIMDRGKILHHSLTPHQALRVVKKL